MNKTNKILAISLEADDPFGALDQSLRTKFLPQLPPESIELEYEELEPTRDWINLVRDSSNLDVHWGPLDFVSVRRKEVIKLSTASHSLRSTNEAVSLLSEPRYQLGVVGSLFLRWEDPYQKEYFPPAFDGRHFPHGFACAFKGAGHDRLVSRRWLKYGPWRLIRDEEQDFSFIQFHDLNADAETALEQAKPGHERMGISDHGGFLQRGYVYETDFDGIYLPDEEILEIVVHGRKIPDVELLDACALRHYQDLGDDKPLKNVRYVFVGGEQQASKYLHELWLRELECWAIVNGDNVRLDEDYEPPAPEKPDWVTKLEDEETE